jgi:hydroxymethylbilane synthase
VGRRVIRIGTRASALARAQTNLVADALRAAQPGLLVEVVPISTSGDRSQHTNLPGPDWGSGVFVKELESALREGTIDLAVHSLKDVPPEPSAGLDLVAIPAREDPRDVLVTPEARGLDDLPAGARLGTSSARRAAFLRSRRPDLNFLPIRGNVDTRVRKLMAGDYDAILLAAAGLHRLGLAAGQVPHVVLDADVLPPAPGQGALGLQARADDPQVARLVAPLDDAPTAAAVAAERRLMARLEGGCRLPIGALATPGSEGRLHMLAMLASPDGAQALRDQAAGRLDQPAALADLLADRLLAAGAAALLMGATAA